MKRGEEIVRDAARLWAPPRRISVSAWADQNLVLSPEYSAQHGQFTAHAYQREPMDCCSDPNVSQVVIKGAVQMLKTIVGQAFVAWAIDVEPGPILVVNQREEDADAFCKERLEPMIRDTPRLQAKMMQSSPGGKKRRKSTLREKWFRGGMLACTFASAPGNLARRAVRYAICEEEDKWALNAGGRGNPFKMLLARMDTFGPLARIFRSSSPSRPGSPIDKAYENSDQRERFVPCPACGHWQSMMGKFFTQVRVDEKLPTKEDQAASARYHCEACDAGWDDLQRWDASERGQWRAGKPFAGIAGFWISGLYSPWKRLSEIVLEYLTVKDDPIEYMTFVNERLAENYLEKGDAPDWELLAKRSKDSYPVGTVPRGGLFLTSGADVQHDRIEVEVVAWGRNRESWSVDYRIFEGNTAQQEVWDRFWAFSRDVWPTEGGALLPISRLFVDSGDQAHVVYDQVRRQPQGQVVAIKGAHAKALMPVSQPAAVDITIAGRKIKGGLKIRHVNGAYFKTQLFMDLKNTAPGPGYCHFPTGQFYGDEHYRQLCAEQLVTRQTKSGRTIQEWEQTRARNEVLDCRVYARAAAYDLGMDRWQPHHWAMLAAQFQGEFELIPTPEQPLAAAPALPQAPEPGRHAERPGFAPAAGPPPARMAAAPAYLAPVRRRVAIRLC